MLKPVVISDFNIIVDGFVWASQSAWTESHTSYFIDKWDYWQKGIAQMPIYLNKQKQKSTYLNRYRWVLSHMQHYHGCAEAQLYFGVFKKVVLMVKFAEGDQNQAWAESVVSKLISAIFAATAADLIQIVGLSASGWVKTADQTLGQWKSIWTPIHESWLVLDSDSVGCTQMLWQIEKHQWLSSSCGKASQQEFERLERKRLRVERDAEEFSAASMPKKRRSLIRKLFNWG